jgi:hypothetical protein
MIEHWFTLQGHKHLRNIYTHAFATASREQHDTRFHGGYTIMPNLKNHYFHAIMTAMNKRHILIVLLGITAAGLSIFAFKIYERSGNCVPREGEEYCIAHNGAWPSFIPETATPYSFSIKDKKGSTIKNFDIMHEKLMHLIVVRKDLGVFQHLHPEFNKKTGEFSQSEITLPTEGTYRIFADFTPQNKEKAIAYEDIASGNPNTYQPTEYLEPKSKAEDGDYTALITTNAPKVGAMETLSFAITKEGAPIIDLEPYLGAKGHLVIIKNNTLDYLHVHANDMGHMDHAMRIIPVANAHMHDNGKLSFMVTFKEAGSYKAFLQIQHKGIVRTFDFTITAQ